MNPFELEAVVKAAANGDTSSFAQLIETERTQMLRTAGYYVRNYADAEDAVQEAVCRAFTALPTLREPRYFRTWLTRIVINASLSLLDRSRKTIPTDGAETERLTAKTDDTDGTLDLLQAVSSLPPKIRRVILLKYMHDLKLGDIAELLGLPLGTVKTYQSKGLNLLREHYRDEIEDRRRAREEVEAGSAAWEDTEMELNEILHHQLRERAKTLAENQSAITGTKLEPFIEDVFHQNERVRELLFIWTKPGTETGISVTLTPDGDLVDYSADADLYAEADKNAHLPPEKLFAIGERFVRDHYPSAPDLFGKPEIEEYEDRVFFTCRQYAGGLPLPHSGFWIDLHRSGFVTAFKYFGAKSEPTLPSNVLTPEQLLEQVAEDMQMKLCFMKLQKSVYAQGDDRVHLLYTPEPFLINRSALPETGESQEETWPEQRDYDPCAGTNAPILDFLSRLGQTEAFDSAALLEDLGIREGEYEIVREADTDDVRSVVYRTGESTEQTREIADSQEPHTLDEYIRVRSENTIKVQFDRISGRVVGLMDFREQTGSLQLDDHACLDIALAWLYAADPLLFPYLRLDKREDDPETPTIQAQSAQEKNADRSAATGSAAIEYVPRPIAHFDFSVCKDGIPGFMHHASVSVDQTTGRIHSYMGADLKTAELERLSLTPSLSQGEAKRRLIEALQPRLIWESDYSVDSDDGGYLLRYVLADRESGRSILMVDAHTGQIVTDKA